MLFESARFVHLNSSLVKKCRLQKIDLHYAYHNRQLTHVASLYVEGSFLATFYCEMYTGATSLLQVTFEGSSMKHYGAVGGSFLEADWVNCSRSNKLLTIWYRVSYGAATVAPVPVSKASNVAHPTGVIANRSTVSNSEMTMNPPCCFSRGSVSFEAFTFVFARALKIILCMLSSATQSLQLCSNYIIFRKFYSDFYTGTRSL
jgi:hypothetical protein